jgi:hypothetical protein
MTLEYAFLGSKEARRGICLGYLNSDGYLYMSGVIIQEGTEHDTHFENATVVLFFWFFFKEVICFLLLEGSGVKTFFCDLKLICG